MKAYRRSLIALGLAALLPVVVFVAVQVLYTLKRDREQIESQTLARSSEVMALVDAKIAADVSAMRVLATSPWLDAPDWAQFYMRCQRVLKSNPHWMTVIVSNAITGEPIMDLRRPLAQGAQGARVVDANAVFHGEDAVIDGIEREGQDAAPLVYLHQPVSRDGRVQYVITVPVDPSVFQQILLKHAPNDPVAAIVDRTARFIARTLHYEQRIGAPGSESLHRAVMRGGSGFYRSRTLEGFAAYTAIATSPVSGWSTHIAVASSVIDGSRIWSYAVATAAGFGAVLLAGFLILLVLREMADRRRADETLRQSQKMEAIGQLTGGIAHDFNNLLTAIIGSVDLIRKRTVDDARLHRLATNALDAARRGAKLTSQLLAFSRNQQIALIDVDLMAMIEGMRELLAQSVDARVQISITIDPQARHVISDPAQLELALLNLAVNARDAMPQGGRFSISSHIANAQDCRELPPGNYVRLDITDTGSGMSEEVRARAFEPFFTTKPVGGGTGLGLSQVFGVVRQSSGATYLRSAPGEGTTVMLILPRGSAQITNIKVEAIADIGPGGPANILVVDDDAQVRTTMVESLRAHGYLVAEASDGADALAQMEYSCPKLLLIDFAMPGRNGAEVARLARDRYPQLKVLMVSGHADHSAISTAIGTVRLLRKPFDTQDLLHAVAATLD
jgi:signal transduction histidine kinase